MSATTSDIEALLEGVLGGDSQALARALTLVERQAPGTKLVLRRARDCGRRAHIVGITGAPGSGKSTLAAALAMHFRAKGMRVAILAVDPSSALTRGAILGDRVRMSALAGDTGVFVRSFSTRGSLGGLSRATLDCVSVVGASGAHVVLVETVGVGQAEVDIIRVADTVVVVSVPGLGDEVQASKAGVLEIADVHVVNKADREGAQRTVAELRASLLLSSRSPNSWNIPIVRTVAHEGAGVEELALQLDRHRRWLFETGEAESRRRRIAALRVRSAADQIVMAALDDDPVRFEATVENVALGELEPAVAARALIRQALLTNDREIR